MLKKIFKYTDLETNEEKTEIVYFHLHEADLVKLQLSVKEGMEGLLKQLIDLEDTAAIIAIFDDMIAKSVGYKNERGKFVRTKQFAEEFMNSEQYSDLFIELLGTPEKQLEFVKGILPTKISEGLDEQLALDIQLPKEDVSEGKKLEDYTRDELLTVSQDQFDKLVGTDPEKMSRAHLIIATQRKLATQGLDKATAKSE